MNATAAPAVPLGLEPTARRDEPPPRLSEGLELLGEVPGSGYRRAPALARRADGQMIKLTPLLYDLVESIDGRRDYDELAAELSRRDGRRAAATDVRVLVEQKLRPLGAIAGADGAQTQTARANPLLRLRPRFVVSNPDSTRRLAAPFTWLFKAPIVIPVLAGFVAIMWWLLTQQGLAAAFHNAFYDPPMMLAVWGVLILAAAFHEIGHAAACRYAGATPGTMGGGLYLVWPTFYTEVSDAYRLDRRGRLTVDLGGLYFSALFAVITTGIWALTGADAILLVVALQLVQMVRQLVPIIRTDGYHVLADLTGVPDLFAHIKPTLLAVLPTRWGRPENKRLKPWARAVVVGWVALVLPALVAILAYATLLLPRLAATAWDSMGQQWASAESFWSQGDPAGVIAKVLSAGIVALPVLGICYLLARIFRRAAVRTLAATAGRRTHRIAAFAGAVLLCVLLSWAWWPGSQYRPIAAQEPGPVPPVALSPEAPPAQLVAAGFPLQVPAPQAPQIVAPTQAAQAAPAAVADSAAAGGHPIAGDVTDDSPPDTSGTIWPFPFDPPATPARDDNRAMAVNTQDDSSAWDVATSMLVLDDGDPVDERNESYALASCRRCTTGAIAFQVILMVGYVQQVTPINIAAAVNYDCRHCNTVAFAYQVAVTLLERPSKAIRTAVNAVLDRLERLERKLPWLPMEQIYLILERAEARILGILGVQEVPGAPVATDEQTANGEEAIEQPAADQPPPEEAPESSSTAPPPESESADSASTEPTEEESTTSPEPAPAEEEPCTGSTEEGTTTTTDTSTTSSSETTCTEPQP